MRDVRNNKQRITRQLEETTDTLDPGRAVLTAALDLLDRPRDLYDTATEHARKLLNKAIFTRLYVDTSPARHPTVTTDDLQEPFGSLMHAIRTTHTGQQPPDPQNSTDAQQHDNQTHLGGLLASALADQSASKAAMVELTGIEPITPPTTMAKLSQGASARHPIDAEQPGGERPSSAPQHGPLQPRQSSRHFDHDPQ
jgi:hypothetical protein